MEISPNAFKSYIQAAFVPVVLVLCTEGVDKICQNQGFSFVDAFKSAIVEKKRVPIRYGENNYDLQDLKVRFVSMKDLEKQEESKMALERAAEVEDVTTDTYSDAVLRDKSQVPYFMRSLSLPWYEKYKFQYIVNGPTVEQEFFHHPVACIIAVSSDDKNPMASLVKLFDPSAPPSIFSESFVEANVPRSYLFVYPNDVPKEAADKRLTEMKTTFPQTPCYLMKASALQEAVAQAAGNPNTANVNTTGRTPDSNVSVFLAEHLAKTVAPYLEKQMAELNEIATTSKKGFLQKMKISFGRKTGSGAAEADANANSSAGEIATRKLADILFFLHDYENALNLYKNCTKEFNNEKMWHFFAASQEIMGLCSYFLGRDTEQFFENAYVYYQKSSQYHYAVRSTFLYGDILKMRGNFKGASDVFTRAAEKDCDMFCSGLFHEQAAFCNLLTSPIMFRKFCFRMVMAASRFQEATNRKHARRCYEIAYKVYEDRNWGSVEDQLHQGLLRIAYYLGRMDEATQFGHKLLIKNSLPFQKQNALVREYLFIAKANTKPEDPMPIVPLPIVVNDSIKVHLHDYSDADSTDWQVLEAAFRMETDPQTVRARQGFDMWKVKEEEDLVNKERVVVSEEHVTIEVEVKNPLQVPLQFTHVHLVGTYHGPPDPSKPVNTYQFSFSEFVDAYAPQAPSPAQNSLPFRVEPFDILLGPSDTKKLTFAVRPLKAGQLVIKGLGLYMCGSAWGRREFDLKPRRMNRTPQQKKAVIHEPNRSLTFKVTDPMPRLEVSCVNFPDSVYRGELRQAGLRLRNCSGRMGLKNVRVRCSHPNAVLFGTQSDPSRASGESFSLDVSLAPGNEVIVPVWIHFSTASPSSVVMRFLFYYESEIGNTDLKYRLTRCSANVSIKPALVLKAATHPAPADLSAYLLHLELANTDSNNVFTFQQITSLSSQWRIESLSFGTEKDIPQDVFTLKPGQSSNTFFRIKRIPEDASITSGPVQSSISITNPSRKPISAFAFPFHDFLAKEKSPESVELPKLSSSGTGVTHSTEQEDLNKVDILLFWESSPAFGAGPRLYGQLSIPKVTFVPSQNASGSNIHSRNSLTLNPLQLTPLPSPRYHPSSASPLSSLSSSATHNPVAVRFLIECPAKVSYDFNAQGLCVISLQLHIANCSNHAALNFDLLTLSPLDGEVDGEGDGELHLGQPQKKKASASQYLWCGTTTHHVDNVAPQANTVLTLSACFFKPGVYNLTRFKLVAQANNTNTTIYAPFQHLITVEQQST